MPEDRRLAFLAVCVSEWQSRLADALVETHDRIVGKLYRSAERFCEAKIADEKTAVRQTLKSFAELGETLIEAQDDGEALGDVITTKPGWDELNADCILRKRRCVPCPAPIFSPNSGQDCIGQTRDNSARLSF